jgi:outer membrane protein assembly factor BamB
MCDSTLRLVTSAFIGLLFFSICCVPANGQQVDGHWNISPTKINIMVGSERRLQALDDLAQEQHGLMWSVNDPELAEIYEDNDRAVLTANAVGTVRVTASLGSETRYLDIKIWPAIQRLPPETTNWGIDPIGRDVGDFPAVPTPGGPHIYSLEQTPQGSTYLRAFEGDGIQTWTWLMPEQTHDVELVCGDWLGGAVISANRADSYTLYVVGRDGKLRWRHDSDGVRNSLAISTDHLLYLLSQSRDGISARLDVFDEAEGTENFQISIPASYEKQTGVRRESSGFVCNSGTVSTPEPTAVSHVIVNMDGYAYLAFTQKTRSLEVANCTAGAIVAPNKVRRTGDDRLFLWQIHQDGSHRDSEVESVRGDDEAARLGDEFFPTPSIVTDNMNGTLIPVRVLHSNGAAPDDFVYRVSEHGELMYKFPLPKYSSGKLHDEMVIGTEDTGFATRGGTLVAFNIRTGKETWRWNSPDSGISVFAALADGGCAVQTSSDLIEVQDGVEAKLIMHGKAMASWQGQMFRKRE